MMTCDEIIEELKANASEKYKVNVVKMGIPVEYSIGVSTAVVRAIAKKAGKSNELARELWNSGYQSTVCYTVGDATCYSKSIGDICAGCRYCRLEE